MRYFDLHCDTASVCFKNNIYPDDVSLAASLSKSGAFDKWYQCFAIFIPDDCPEPKSEYRLQISDFKSKIQKFDTVKPVYTLENALPVDSADFVEILVKDNISAVTLTWNGENQLAGGANTDVGLKPLGKEVIDCLNRNRIAVDLSHLSYKSFFDVAKRADAIFASHVCCYKTHKHKRNLTDEQIRIIAEREGVIGICFYPEFLGTKYAFEGVWRHLYHLLNMGLENSIAIGSDFDGAKMTAELDGVDKIPDLFSFLIRKGIAENTLEKMFFKNSENFFKKL